MGDHLNYRSCPAFRISSVVYNETHMNTNIRSCRELLVSRGPATSGRETLTNTASTVPVETKDESAQDPAAVFVCIDSYIIL